MKNKFRSLLLNLPVSINNLADPAILAESTANKLNTLVEDGHTGPVALITKGNLNTPWWRENLKFWASRLNLFVFVSISGLPREIEPFPTEHRWQTIKVAKEAGCKVISYIRPIIHTINDSEAIIRMLFEKSVFYGADAIVSSGFRGDSDVVASTGIGSIQAPDAQQWMKTLKLTPQVTSDFMVTLASELGIPYWTRTQCAVTYLSGGSRSLNPYFIAPKFVGCDRCPIKSSCADSSQFMQPVADSVELLEYLGFKIDVHTPSNRYKQCDVQIRSQCSLCCTNCPTAPANLGVPYINIRNHKGEVPSWGEMSLARFLTGGMLATDPLIPPGENSEIRLHDRFKMPDGLNGQGGLYGVNSWLVWSEYLPKEKCFNCSYCFLSMFKEVLPEQFKVTVGMSPVRILDMENI
jgi:hypothetical protein